MLSRIKAVGILYLFLGLLLSGLTPGFAQSPLATIRGGVTDPSGASIPNANVTATDEAKGTKRSQKTNEVGQYEISQLDPGTYTIEVESQGFQTYVNHGLTLIARQVLRVDVQMVVGAVTQRLTVEAVAPLINTESQTIAGGYERKSLEDFHSTHQMSFGPLHLIMTMMPSVAHTGDGRYTTHGTRSIGMQRATQDGADTGGRGYNPQAHTEVTALQEIKVVTTNASAEYDTPMVADAVTKSGTNTFHAGYFMEFRNEALNALGTAPGPRPPGTPFLTYEGYGGGPVVIPKVYNGRNKTFWFADLAKAKKAAFSQIGAINVPPEAWRKGDFSSFTGTLLDPLTGQPFPGNVIPSSRLNPSALKLQERFWPLPNLGAPGQLGANHVETRVASAAYHNFFYRVDHQLRDNDKLFFSHNSRVAPLQRDQHVFTQGLDATKLGLPKEGKWLVGDTGNFFALSEVHVWRSVVNEVRVGYYRLFATRSHELRGQEILKFAGITGINPALDFTGAPRFFIAGFAQFDPFAASGDAITNRFEWRDNVSIRSGRHAIKLGMDARRLQRDSLSQGNFAGTWSFDGNFTRNAWADFLLGLPRTSSRFVPRPWVRQRQTMMGYYFMDDFKVSDRLTLNLGLRFNWNGIPTDRTGGYFNFDLKTGALVIPSEASRALINPSFPKNVPILTASQAGFPPHLVNSYKKGWQPRVGLAYRPFGNKTVFRLGYGLFSTQGDQVLPLFTGGPFALTESFTNNIVSGVPDFQWPNGFPTGAFIPPSQSVNGINPNQQDGSYQQWNVSIEREVRSTVLRISYIGSKSSSLLYTRDINKPQPSTTPFSQARRPYPLYFSASYTENGGNATYHGFEFEAKRRFASGFTYNVGYNYQKTLEDVHDDGGRFRSATENPYDRSTEKGRANGVPMPHHFSANWVYELPVGRGKRFLSSGPGIANQVLGGWMISGMISAFSGRWFTPRFSGFDPSNTNTIGGRADSLRNGNLPASQRSEGRWFDPTAFAVPGCPESDPFCLKSTRQNVGRFGNGGFGSIQGPGAFYWQQALYKTFPIYESLKLRVGVTTVNFLNHPNWDFPELNIRAASAGQLFADPVFVDFPNRRLLRFEARIEF